MVRNRSLETSDYYPLSQTPLRYLLAEHIDLLRDTDVISVSSDDTSVTVVIEEAQVMVGTNRLMIMFDAKNCNSSSGPSPIRRGSIPLSLSTISIRRKSPLKFGQGEVEGIHLNICQQAQDEMHRITDTCAPRN